MTFHINVAIYKYIQSGQEYKSYHTTVYIYILLYIVAPFHNKQKITLVYKTKSN